MKHSSLNKPGALLFYLFYFVLLFFHFHFILFVDFYYIICHFFCSVFSVDLYIAITAAVSNDDAQHLLRFGLV